MVGVVAAEFEIRLLPHGLPWPCRTPTGHQGAEGPEARGFAASGHGLTR